MRNRKSNLKNRLESNKNDINLSGSDIRKISALMIDKEFDMKLSNKYRNSGIIEGAIDNRDIKYLKENIDHIDSNHENYHDLLDFIESIINR